MKVKHVLASLALASVTAFGLAAGLSAKKEVKVAKADTEKTWMMCFNINLHEMVDYEGFDGNTVKVYCWNSLDSSVKKEFSMHQSGITGYYTVNATFEAGWEFDNVQYEFYQGGASKQSLVYDTVSNQSEESHNSSLTNASYGHWDGDNYVTEYQEDTDHVWRWKITGHLYYDPFIKVGDTPIYMDENLQSGEFYKTNVEVVVPNNQDVYLNIQFAYDWRGGTVMTESAKALFKSPAENGSAFKESGTYDFFFTNNYHDGGILDIKKHEEESTYIYYVTASSTETVDYIYSWGGSNQFGAFPGTKLVNWVDDEPVYAAGVEEVTGGGVLHFQNNYILIYKIPVIIGYPGGDYTFMFNNGTNSSQSDERALVAGAAYWWTGDANLDAAEALEFLQTAETIRNGAADYSVCNVTPQQAYNLVNTYNGLSETVRETYIDQSTVYTWTTEEVGELAPEGLVSYRAVVEQLGEIGHLAPIGSSLYIRNQTLASDNSVVLLTVMFSSVAVVGLITLIILKKKRTR